MNNRVSEHFEGPDEQPAYKEQISRLSLLYTGGIAYQGIMHIRGTNSFTPADPHTFLGIQFYDPSSVCFRFHHPVTHKVVEVHGPIDRCSVRVIGGETGSLEIAFAQTGEEWFVDRPVLGQLTQLLTSPDGN